MMQVLIVGHSPGKIHYSKSITRNRVQEWLNHADIKSYDWINLVNYHAPDLKLSEVTIMPKQLEGYDKIIALGNMPSVWLSRNQIEHLKVPHPSGLNRMWNDPDMEPNTMQKIRQYILETI